MDQKIENLILQKVHKEQGWKTDEVRLDEVDRLRRGSCSFYTAGHTVRPLSYQLNYAVLNADTVISLADEKAVSKIVESCGKDANAGWWAEIVTRFHQDLGSGVVLHEATTNTGAVQKIKSVNKEFANPSFGTSAGSKTVTFHMLEPESFSVFSVTAAFHSDGSVTVTQTSIA